MSDYRTRVIDEQIELSGRVARLTAFIGGELYHGLPFDERCRLVAQLKFMEGYEAILLQRIEASQRKV